MTRRVITGSVIVVVGATSGVGRATSLSLASNGARLVLASRDADELADLARSCSAAGGEAIAVPTDIRDADAVDVLRRRAVERFGRIDTWINTAAVLVVGEIDAQPVDDIAGLIATNVLGSALLSRAAITQFRAQGHGVLINVSSLLGVVPNPVVPTYTMTKFAVRGLTLSLHAATRWRSPIRVCVVLPGPIDTPMFRTAGNHSGRAIRAIPPAASPERVAATIIRSVRRPRRQRTVGAVGALIVLGEHVLPRFTEAVVAAVASRLIFRPERVAPTSGSVHSPLPAESAAGGYRRNALRRRLGDALGRTLARRP